MEFLVRFSLGRDPTWAQSFGITQAEQAEVHPSMRSHVCSSDYVPCRGLLSPSYTPTYQMHSSHVHFPYRWSNHTAVLVSSKKIRASAINGKTAKRTLPITQPFLLSAPFAWGVARLACTKPLTSHRQLTRQLHRRCTALRTSVHRLDGGVSPQTWAFSPLK